MTTQFDDPLEARLAGAFQRGGLPGAPYTLLSALDRVVETPLERGRPAGGRVSRRSTWTLLGVAAVIATGGLIALVGGGRDQSLPRPTGRPSVAAGTVLTYQIQWSAATPSSPEALAAELDVVRGRLAGTLAAASPVRADGSERLVAELPAGVDVESMRRRIGATGVVRFVPLGRESKNPGDLLSDAEFPPLFSGGSVTSAKIATDQSGEPALDITFDAQSTRLLGDYTRAHIGEYFAITLDDVVVSAPVIQSEIPGGDLEISGLVNQGSDVVESLAAILTTGPLPAPLTEVGVELPTASPSKPEGSAAGLVGDPFAGLTPDCDPPLDVVGEQLSCEEAVTAALGVLPADLPAIERIAFRHTCIDVLHPDLSIDCATQVVGTVLIRFAGGDELEVAVSKGNPPQIATWRPLGRHINPSLALEVAPVGATCASARLVPTNETPAPRELVTIRIDPGLEHPVWAVRADGTVVPVGFDGSVTSIASPVPLILGPQLTVIAHDASVLVIGQQPVPGIDLCLAPDGGLLLLG